MRQLLGPAVIKRAQQIFWIYLTNNFVVTATNDFKTIDPSVTCAFLPITSNNCSRVREFRDGSRSSEYLEKVTREEIGFFAEFDGKVVGSIWATINKTEVPTVVRSYMRLMPNEALVHDIVTGEEFRGMGIGTFMASRIFSILLGEREVSKIIIDVNVRNVPSLRMMQKAGLQINHRMLSISAFGKLISQRVLR